jgi:hypothetical protein
MSSRKLGNPVGLGLEILEDRLSPSGLGLSPGLGSLPPLPTGTLGFTMSAPTGLTPPPALTSASQLFSGPPPSGQLPSLPANVIAMAEQIFAQMAAMYGSAFELAINHGSP